MIENDHILSHFDEFRSIYGNCKKGVVYNVHYITWNMLNAITYLAHTTCALCTYLCTYLDLRIYMHFVLYQKFKGLFSYDRKKQVAVQMFVLG